MELADTVRPVAATSITRAHAGYRYEEPTVSACLAGEQVCSWLVLGEARNTPTHTHVYIVLFSYVQGFSSLFLCFCFFALLVSLTQLQATIRGEVVVSIAEGVMSQGVSGVACWLLREYLFE